MMQTIRVTTLAVGLLLGGAAGAFAARAHRASASRSSAQAAAATSGPTLDVPRAAGPIVIDGELEDLGWTKTAHTGAFQRNGAESRPFSEARATYADGTLYLMLYAADEDLRGGEPSDPEHGAADAFRVRLEGPSGAREIAVSPDHFVASGAPGFAERVHVGHDADGTLDDPKDDDEEWVAEVAVPLSDLGLRGQPGERITASIERCDTVRPRPGPSGDPGGRRCASWSGDRAGTFVLR